MKKLIYLLFSISIIALTISCEDYNIKNFEGYEQLQRPTNLAAYNYQLTPTDFVTIGDAVKKPVETEITAQNALLTAKLAELKTAKTNADTLRIRAEHTALIPVVAANIVTLKLKPEYVAGMFIRTNKFFNETYPASNYASLFLNSKYKYADKGSSVQLTYKYVNPLDTVSVTAANKYTLTVDDYKALGEAAGQPGQFNNFSATIDQDVYIPRLLAVKYPLAQKGDIKLIRYMFFVTSPATLTYSLYQHNGTAWTVFSKTEQFVFANSNEWMFDPTITFAPDKADFTSIMAYLDANKEQRIKMMEGLNEWTEKDTARFIFNPSFPPLGTDYNNVRTEFFFGSSWWFLNFDVRITSRIYKTDIALTRAFAAIDANTSLDGDAKTAAKNAFLEKRVIQGMALMLAIKYPELVTQVKGIDQYVKVNVLLFTGARWYWTYKFQCVEKGKFKYIERTKWK
ncbi:MAG: hypothetical protein Q7U47_05705 [Paludibacter sp.]|nr:hypothetical protein [Paludibacter sp.]